MIWRKICNEPRCGKRFETDDKLVTRCPTHQPAFRHQQDEHRRTRQRQHGRDQTSWRRLRAQAIALAAQCDKCGKTSDLTVHLDPALHGNHAAATLDDLTVLCSTCHGRIDGPRARRQA